MNDTIIKVRRTSSMLDDISSTVYHKETYYTYENSSEDESNSDDCDSESGKRDRRRRKRSREKRNKSGRVARSRHEDEETKNLRYELEEIKKLIQKVQEPTTNTPQISSSPSTRPRQALPFVDAYAVSNRLAPPVPPAVGIPQGPYSGSMLPPASYGYSAYRPPLHPWDTNGNPTASGYWEPPAANNISARNQQPFEQYPRGPYRPQRSYPRYDRSQVTCFNCGVIGHWRTECPLLGYPSSDNTNAQYRNGFPTNLPQPSSNDPLALRQSSNIPSVTVTTMEGGKPTTLLDHGGPSRTVGTVAGIEIDQVSSAFTGMTMATSIPSSKAVGKKEFVREIMQKTLSGNTDYGYIGEAMGGERARRHSEVPEISGTPVEPLAQKRRFTYKQPGQEAPQRKIYKQKGKRPPIRLMVDQKPFDFIAGFRDTLVAGLSWGQYFDLAPEAKRQFVRLMVQERAKGRKGFMMKGKGAAEAPVLESALVEASLVGKYDALSSVVNFYTAARVMLNGRIFELKHVLVDGGSVVNLAPISVLQAMGADLFCTQELTIRTATSSLVEIEFYTDLDIEVASVVTPLRVYAIPATCEPTFGLLLSRRWLRQVQAIGDYARHTYIIKDQFGKEYKVPCEKQLDDRTAIRPRIGLNHVSQNANLDTEEVEELLLDEELSFEEIVKQVTDEAYDDLAAYDYSDGEYDTYTTESEVEVDDSNEEVTSENYGGDESSSGELLSGEQEN